MNQITKTLYDKLSTDIGIDLGTANTLVVVRGEGIIINEPSVVAINQKTGQVVAIGGDARSMLGRTPQHIVAVRPLVDGVISDFEATEEMIHYFIKKTQAMYPKKIIRPRVVVGVPSGVTNVERRAVRDAVMNAGAREVHIVEEPMAAAIGIRMPVYEPLGTMIVDIGGGTTDIAVISLGGIVKAKSLRVAGDRLNNDIVVYVRDEFKMLIGEKTAEEVKIAIGTVHPRSENLEAVVRGRDLVTGLPREIVLTNEDVTEAIGDSVALLVAAVKEVLELTPPEIISDIMHRGIVLTGGGALLRGLPKILEDDLKMPIYISDDPLTAVVRGTGLILEDLDFYRELLVTDEQDLPPQ